MDKRNSISTGQLFCLFFVAHSTAILTGTQLQGAGDPQALLLAAPFSLVLSAICLLPLLRLCSRHEGMSVLDCARFRFSNAGGAVFCTLYGAYFLYTPSLAVARYNIYVSATMQSVSGQPSPAPMTKPSVSALSVVGFAARPFLSRLT